MMHHPIPKGGRTDHTLFGIMDVKGAVGPRLVAFRLQLFQQLKQLVLQIYLKSSYIGVATLAFPGFVEGPEEVVESAYIRIQITKSFHNGATKYNTGSNLRIA